MHSLVEQLKNFVACTSLVEMKQEGSEFLIALRVRFRLINIVDQHLSSLYDQKLIHAEYCVRASYPNLQEDMERDREAAKKLREKEEERRRAAAAAELAEAERKAAAAATAAEKKKAEEDRRKRAQEEEERRKREKEAEERQRRELEKEIMKARVAAAEATLGLTRQLLPACVTAGLLICSVCCRKQLNSQFRLWGSVYSPFDPLFFSATEDETKEEQDGRARCYRIQRAILELTPTILAPVLHQAWNIKTGRPWSSNRLQE